MFNINLILILIIFCLFQRNIFCSDVREHKNWPKESEEQCGLSRSMRIIGGEVASIGQFPWIAHLGYITYQGDNKFISYLCGGSLINSLYVVTAAHCVYDKENKTKDYIFQLGAINTNNSAVCEDNVCTDEPIIVDVVNVTIHKGYDSHTQFHDIALMKLKEPVKFTEWIKPICLPFGKMIDEDNVGKIVDVAGWGLTDSEKSISPSQLLYVKIPVQNNSVCYNTYGKYFEHSERQVCLNGESEKNSCFGDSGGPAVAPEDSELGPRYFLIGIVSYGPNSCGTKQPTVYTNVKYYMPWILDHLI